MLLTSSKSASFPQWHNCIPRKSDADVGRVGL